MDWQKKHAQLDAGKYFHNHRFNAVHDDINRFMYINHVFILLLDIKA